MIETLKHLIGWCGEGHGLLHAIYVFGGFIGAMLLYVFGAFIGTMFLYVYNTMRWWIRDNIWRK